MFTDAEKLEAEALLGEAFDSYKERIIIYKTPATAFVASSSSNFNFGFGEEQPAASVEYVTQSGEFWATIEYMDHEADQQMFYAKPDAPIQQPYGDVRIATTGEIARDFLENAEKIVFDGKDFRRVSDVMPRGLFSRQGFDCWLKKIDNG